MDDIQRYGGGLEPIPVGHEEEYVWGGAMIIYGVPAHGRADDHMHIPTGSGYAGGNCRDGYYGRGMAVAGRSPGEAQGSAPDGEAFW